VTLTVNISGRQTSQ